MTSVTWSFVVGKIWSRPFCAFMMLSTIQSPIPEPDEVVSRASRLRRSRWTHESTSLAWDRQAGAADRDSEELDRVAGAEDLDGRPLITILAALSSSA